MAAAYGFLPNWVERSMKRPTILLADDDKALLERVRQLLEPEFEVLAKITDGKALVSAARQLQPDLIVADISMPCVNGFQAARQIKEEQPETRILFLTVHEEPVLVSEALALGVAGYVVKRSAAADLIPALRELLQGRSFVSPVVQQ
ncbi:MAG: response regulator transcription factor [Acidobacteria bacterium]|nr:response regulator transcription factor [Acidobacteriota bacterium]